ncbi:MAG: hypothetical protein WC323_00705 [Patescibacteria group bacterium]|jgi:hypothetical protein
MSIKQGAGIKNSAEREAPAVELQQLKELLDENIQLTKELEEKVQKINRYIKWQRSFTLIKIFIIVVPIILGIIYLPPILKDLMNPYQELLNNTNSLGSGLDVNSLLNEFTK